MLEKTNKGEGCFEWRSLRSTGMNRSDTIRAHGDARQAHLTGLIPAQPSFLLAPVFPGCHPATNNPAKTGMSLSRQSRGLETTSLRVRLPLSVICPKFQERKQIPFLVADARTGVSALCARQRKPDTAYLKSARRPRTLTRTNPPYPPTTAIEVYGNGRLVLESPVCSRRSST